MSAKKPADRFLLLQIRNQDDPMLTQEVGCFARMLGCRPERIQVFDLISGVPSVELVQSVDVVLLGGSGDYSVAEGGDWLPAALESMQELYELGKPTFASCWGCQAMAQALGGRVVTDLDRAELGTIQIRLTDEGRHDSLFAPLGDSFQAQMGHQDCVDVLPPDAIRLASTDLVANQAFRIANKPIYCTQFHPELDRAALIERLEAYPQYVEKLTGESFEEFIRTCRETEATNLLLKRFMKLLDAGKLGES